MELVEPYNQNKPMIHTSLLRAALSLRMSAYVKLRHEDGSLREEQRARL